MLEYTRRYIDGIPCTEETAIRYELDPGGDGTILRITHSGFEVEQVVMQHKLGWERVWGCLAQYLNRVHPTLRRRSRC